MTTLSERASSVLYSAVTEFISTGEPVGSRTLSKRYGLDLSAATIRNVLKDLEEDGYLTQPHTSAGRIPTDRAFRLFIDALMRLRRLPEQDSGRIRELFAHSASGGDRLREAGKLLSELSGVPAVVLRTNRSTRSVRKIRFIPTAPGELLSVIVLDDGSVENRFISQERPIEPSQLERLHNLLDEVTSERTLTELFTHLHSLATQERDELGALGQLGDSLVSTALRGVGARQEVIIEGRTSLFQTSEDPERLKLLLLALEDREQLVRLLDRTLGSSRVQVFLGSESEQEAGSPLSLVAAAYHQEDRSVAGALGVLGPTRMDYPGLVPLVGAMANAMSRALGYAEGGEGAREAETEGDFSTEKEGASRVSIDRESGGG